MDSSGLSVVHKMLKHVPPEDRRSSVVIAFRLKPWHLRHLFLQCFGSYPHYLSLIEEAGDRAAEEARARKFTPPQAKYFIAQRRAKAANEVYRYRREAYLRLTNKIMFTTYRRLLNSKEWTHFSRSF